MTVRFIPKLATDERVSQISARLQRGSSVEFLTESVIVLADALRCGSLRVAALPQEDVKPGMFNMLVLDGVLLLGTLDAWCAAQRHLDA